MKKIIIAAFLILFSMSSLSAQDYKWAVGARIGGEMSGLSGKYKFNSANAIEAIMAIPYDNGFVITALYERNVPVIAEGFNFYYGAGGHLGSWDKDFAFGVDGIIGLEYKVSSVPLAFSVDYKPVFNIVTDTHFYMADFALTMKVTF